MTASSWDRRDVLKTISVGGAAALLGAVPRRTAAQQVKWSGGTERPKLQAPPHACDCHHFIYDSRYPVDRRGIPFPGDALVEDYRALQRRLGITRQVIVQPSTYGLDNRATLAALTVFGRDARGVVVVNDRVADAELRRMHQRGVRGIQFNFAPSGPTTTAMIEPLSRRISDLGWHVEINVWAAELPQMMPILDRVRSTTSRERSRSITRSFASATLLAFCRPFLLIWRRVLRPSISERMAS